ncbi:MAG: arylsulfatase A, partial [bacterium]|nr:arylsulfatase A [bacterium]
FLPQLKGERGNPREWIYTYYNPRPARTKPVRFVREQRWKLYGDGRFYDVSADSLEERPVTKVRAPSEAATALAKLNAALKSMPAEGQTLLKFAP